jgi:hypothetical protein
VSKVIAFPGKRPAERPPPLATPMPPSWAERHLDQFFDLDHWPVSQRGNRYLRLDGYCITAFPRPRRLGVVHRQRRQAQAFVVNRDVHERALGPRRRMGMAGRVGEAAGAP